MYLNRPLMLATETGHPFMYIVNQKATPANSFEIVVINKETSAQQSATEFASLTQPQHIALVNNHLFVFQWGATRDTVRVYPITTSPSFSIGTPVNITLDAIRPSPFNECTAYHIVPQTGGGFKIYYAKGQTLRYETYDASLGYVGSDSLPPLQAISVVNITSITNNGETVYSSAGTPTAQKLYEDSMELDYFDEDNVNRKTFIGLASLTNVGDRLIFIAGGLHTMSAKSPFAYYEHPISNNDFNMEVSQKPVYVVANSATEIYVIDENKKSICLYNLNDNGALEYKRTIIGSIGANMGYHHTPHAITVIDENRYVIIDEHATKLIDTSKNTIVDYAPIQAASIVFDQWRTVYITRMNGRVHALNISQPPSANNPRQLEVGFITPTMKLTNSLGIEVDGDDLDMNDTSATVINGMPDDLRTQTSKWSLCRLTGRVFYIADNHAIRWYKPDPSYWNPSESQYAPIDWRDNIIEYQSPEHTDLFMQIKTTAILYAYPNALRPQLRLEGSKLQVLSLSSSMNELDANKQVINTFGPFDDYATVLYRGGLFYVHVDELDGNTNYYTENLGFHQDNINRIGRVLVHNLPVYRYPFGTDASLALPYQLYRNYGGLTDNTSGPGGLRILRLITEPDSRRETFYEIRIDADGKPNHATGTHVGYVSTELVMDSHKGPDRVVFTSNARVVFSTNDIANRRNMVYSDDQGTLYSNTEKLSNRQGVRVVGELDRSKKYTLVEYEGYGRILSGWIETKFIVPNGITPWQIVAIVGLIAAIGGAIAAVTIHVRARKKKHLDIPEVI